MHVTVKWSEGIGIVAKTDSQHRITMDGPLEAGGQNRGPRPMEVVLAGTGACTSFDVVFILRRSRQEITDCVTEIEAERAETDPKIFTRIHFHFIVTGKNLRPQIVERAIQMSATKYCSASIMLEKTAKITHDFEIRET